MAPPKPVNGALIPATTSQTFPPHSTDGSHARLITGEPAARCRPQPNPDTSPGHWVTASKMLFSDLYKSTKLPLPRLRQQSQPQPQPQSQSESEPKQPVSVSREYDPDLLSKDKTKQKEAVRRFLADRVRNDWVFKWPPVPDTKDDDVDAAQAHPSNDISDVTETEESGLDGDDDASSVYSTIFEDPAHFCPRADWLSDLSDEDEDEPVSPSAYRFESPEAVGSSVKATALARSAKRRRAARAEMEWNTGLACFTARRDAWTCAKVARVRPKPAESATTSPAVKRLSFWRLSSSTASSSSTGSPTESTISSALLSLTATRNSGDTTAVSSLNTDSKEPKAKDDSSQYPVQTLLPMLPPLLPAANPMRASITPATYTAIYDKIVVHALTPACPVNLADVLGSCVAGWKRDGEWPPRQVEVVPAVVAQKKKRKDSITDNKRSSGNRRLSFNLLRRLSAGSDPNATPETPNASKQEDTNSSKGMRRSLQRVLGLGQDT
ncbi:hypothetical protein F4861DRAFT_206324 [Xylaria intraflava]|nr:hypothetical protein F4861DRAFT_206324 [Xylaria intraflava]